MQILHTPGTRRTANRPTTATFSRTLLIVAVFCISLLSHAQTYVINTAVGSTIAGTSAGFSGDGGQATAAQLKNPFGVAVDAAGNIYIADYNNQRIRKVTVATGIITTIAGTGTGGYNGDGIAATTAQLKLPHSVAVDASGNVYIADYSNNRIRKIDATTGIISTYAGGTATVLGDGGQATAAKISAPQGLAFDPAGNLYIADYGQNRVRRVDKATGIITTVAGSGTTLGDGGLATAAQLKQPTGMAFTPGGDMYISDQTNHRIRKVDASTGIITTVAGTGSGGYNGDGIAATTAKLNYPQEVELDAAGNIYVADVTNSRLRKIDITTGLISTIAGTGVAGFSGDGGLASAAQVSGIDDIAFDASGNMYIIDANNNRVRKINVVVPPLQPDTIIGVRAVCAGASLTYGVAAVTGATGYTWTLPYGWSGTSTTNSITVTAGTTGGTISVTASNLAGNSPARSLTVAVSTSVPAQPGTVSGATSVASGQSQVYSVAAVSGATFYTWSLPAGWSGSSSTNTITATVGQAGTISVTAGNACGTSAAATLAVQPSSVWIGTIAPYDWSTSGNWAGGNRPTGCGSQVSIPSGVPAPVITSSVTIGSLDLKNNLSISSSMSLSICGDLDGGSATVSNITGSNASVILNGTSLQTLTGRTSFTKLVVDNTGAGIATPGTITISEGIVIKRGNVANGTGSVTLRSTATGTAYLDDFTNATAGMYTGSLTVQQYIANSSIGYRDLSAPVSSTVADWAADFPVFGQDAVSCWYAYSPYPNLQEYKESANSITSQYAGGFYSYTATSRPLVPMQGYPARLYTAPLQTDLTGTPNTGPQSRAITKTSSSTPSADGWNLVGNPYPSSILWSNIKAMNSGKTDGSCYRFKTTGEFTGTWATHNGVTGTNGATNEISSSQGFFILASGNSNFVMNNTVRSVTQTAFFKTETALPNEIRLLLSRSGVSDEVVAYTDSSATWGYDAGYDAVKIPAGSSVYISFLAPQREYAIDVVDTIGASDVFPLMIWGDTTGTYTLHATTLNLLDTTLTAYLKDSATNTLTRLADGPIALTLTGQQNYTRYSVVFKRTVTTTPSGITDQDASAMHIYTDGDRVFIKRNDNTPATIEVSNVLGQQITSVQTSDALTQIDHVAAGATGIILVRVTEGQVQTVRKLFVTTK